MGDGARGEFEKRQKRDERRLTELVALWFNSAWLYVETWRRTAASAKCNGGTYGQPPVPPTLRRYISPSTAQSDWQVSSPGKRLGAGVKEGEAKAVSANTLNHELAYLRAVFNELERLGRWKGENRWENSGLKFDETEMAYLTRDQIGPLLAELDKPFACCRCSGSYLLGHGCALV